MLVMRLPRLNGIERAQHTHTPFTVAAVVADRLVTVFEAAQRFWVLENAGNQVRVVERVRGRDGRPTVGRSAAGTQ